MLKTIFRKVAWLPSYNDGSLRCNYTESFVKDDVMINGVVSSIVSLKNVDMSLVPALPTAKEYDLDEQLKAGVKPQLINVRGILGGDFNVGAALNKLQDFVDKSLQVVEKDKVNNEEVKS